MCKYLRLTYRVQVLLVCHLGTLTNVNPALALLSLRPCMGRILLVEGLMTRPASGGG